jgi:LuxR family transcriptional regulator, maltose regulon positive regulatory protein
LKRPSDRLPSKLLPPRSVDATPRPRLYRALDALSGRLVTWIQAPAGAGKTTLLTAYLTRQPHVLWYHVDSGDRDPSNLFHYLPLAIASLTGVRLALTSPPAGPPSSQRLLARRFFDACFAELPAETCLVFDNYQDAGTSAGWNQAFRELCAAATPQMRIFVASRGRPPPPLARLVAHGALGLIEWQALRLDRREVAAFLRGSGHRRLRGAGGAAELLAITGGWAVAVALLANRRVSPVGEEAVSLGTGQPGQLDTLFQYFGSEILERLDEPTREVLLDVALFPFFTSEMAVELSEREDAAELLLRVHREHLLIDHEAAGFRLHDLLRQFLLRRGREVRPDQYRASRALRAAGILARADQFQAAAELLIATNQWPALGALIVEHAPRLASEGRASVIAAGLDRLPESIVAGQAWLLYWKAVLMLGSAGVEAERLATRAFELFRAAGDAAGTALAWALVVQVIVFSRDDFRALGAWLDRSDALELALPPQIAVRVAHSRVLAAMHVEPSSARCRDLAAGALAIVRRHGTPDDQALLGGAVAMLHLLAGDCAFALDAHRRTQGTGTAPARNELLWVSSLFFDAMLTLHLGDLQSANDSVKQGLELARALRSEAWTRELLGLAAASALQRGDLQAAERTVDRMGQGALLARRADRGYYAYLRARLAFERNDLVGAVRWNEESAREEEQLGFRPGMGATLVAEIALRAVAQDRPGVERTWARLESFLGAEPGLIWTVASALLHAYTRLCFEEDASDALATALREMRRSGLRSILFVGRRIVSRVVGAALEQGLELDVVHQIVRQYDLEPDAGALTSAAWPWPVKIRGLGELSIIVGDSPVQFGRKTPVVPLALLKILLGHGNALTPERLNRALWPAYGDNGPRGALNTALYRLRKLLGSEAAIETANGHVRLAERVCWTDTAAFAATCARIEALAGAAVVDEGVLARCEVALLDLYRGALGTEHDPKAVLRARERLEERFVRAAATLEGLFRRAGNARRAASLGAVVRTRTAAAERNR